MACAHAKCGANIASEMARVSQGPAPRQWPRSDGTAISATAIDTGRVRKEYLPSAPKPHATPSSTHQPRPAPPAVPGARRAARQKASEAMAQHGYCTTLALNSRPVRL